MPNQAPKTDRGHVAYLRRNKDGSVSQIKEKAKPKKKSGPRFETGEEIYYKRPGADQRTRRGHIKHKTRTGWVVLGRPDGKLRAASEREVFVPDAHVQSKKQYEKKKAAKGTRTATGTQRREISVDESNRRAAKGAKRFPMSEEQVLAHPTVQAMMTGTITNLAASNKIYRGPTRAEGGIKWSTENMEYNDLVSDYLTASATALRKELADAPKADLDTFADHLQGIESGSRIFVTVTTAGRNAVMAHLKARAKRANEHISYDESDEDPGVRRRMAQVAPPDDGFHFDFDDASDPHLWGQDQVYDPTGADPYEQMRYREALIEHFVGKLDPASREVIERKYAIGPHLQPQTNSEIAKELKLRSIKYPAADKDWNRQSVTPVHDNAITTLRNLDDIDSLKDEYQRMVKPRLKKSLTAVDFFAALREHLQLLKSHGPTRWIAPGIVLRQREQRCVVTFDPRLIATSGSADFAKSYSSELAKKNPGGKWITVKEGPLSGRHIFILPHKNGSATVLSGGGPSMRHKLLSPRKEGAGKKAGAEGEPKPSADKTPEKKELSEERRSEIEGARQQHRQAIREEKGKIADIVRQHLGQEVELTDKDRQAIEKKVESIADPKQKAAERLRQTFAVKKERDTALQEVLTLAKQSVVEENPTATSQDAQPTVAAVVKAHAEDLLQHHYRIKAMERDDKELRKLLKTGNEKRQVDDHVAFEPLSREDLKKIIVDEDLRDKEMAAHYKLAATVRGYVDDKGDEHRAKGGTGVERNLRTGGYEALTGMVGELTGNSIMDKGTYDEIGARGSAVLAHYYLRNSGIGSKKLSEHLVKDLADIGSKIAERAVRKGDEFMEMADKVKKTGYGEASLMEAAQARGAALKYVNKAYETYAQAQGALNQAAELAYDAAGTTDGKVEIAAASKSTLEQKRRRLGLKAADVKVEKDGSGFKMTVKPAAYEKLLHEYATPKTGGIAGEGYGAEDIKGHRANTDDFHPAGLREYTPPDKEGNSRKIDLSPSQQAAARFIEKQKRVYLNYEAGTGKSLSVIAAKAHLEEQTGQQKKMIVSMPSPIMKNFASEVAKFSDYKVAVIEPSDTSEQRRAKYASGPDTIVVVNHEKMNFDQADISKAGFHMVVADEAHTITQRETSGKSQKSEGLKKVARQAEHYVAMSGTPVPADLSQLYFHANLMNPEKFGSQKEFMSRFGSAHKGEGMKEKIADFMNRELSDHVITAKKGRMLKPDGKPVELRMKTHFAPLTDKQRDAYRATVAAVKDKKISQLQAENRMKGTLNDTHHEENGKFEHIKKLIDDHMAKKGSTEKVSLYVNSYAGADNIHAFLEKHYPEHGVVRFANRDRKQKGEKTGRNYTAKEKAGFIDEFKQNEKVRFGIHTMAGTTGLNVQHDGNGGGATTVIAVSSGESGYSTIDQFFSRAYRTGANRDVDAHMVLTDTPYDLGTKLRLDEKKAVQEMLRSHPEELLLLRKAKVRAHTRRTKSGGVAQVKEHQDSRGKKAFTFKIKEVAGKGFAIESDNGGGIVIEGKAQPLFMGGNPAKIFPSRDAAQKYASRKKMTIEPEITDGKFDRRELKRNIEKVAKEEGKTEIEIITMMQTGATMSGKEEMIGILGALKRVYIRRAQKQKTTEPADGMTVGKTRVTLGKRMGVVNPKLAGKYRKAPGDLDAASAAAFRYGAQVGKPVLLIPGNSYMQRVWHITTGDESLSKFTAMPHDRDMQVVVVKQNGEAFQATALPREIKKAHVRQHTRRTASGSVSTVREHDDKRKKKTVSRPPRQKKRLADLLDAGLASGQINKRQFQKDRKALREGLKDLKKKLKTAGPRQHTQIARQITEVSEKLDHYNEAYDKHEFLSPKQKAQLQWFRDKQKIVMPDNDDLLQAIAKLGGIKAETAKGQWGLSNKDYPALTDTKIWGKPVLRVTAGHDPDKMAEMLAGYGFVKTDAHGKHDFRDFEEKLLRAASGEKIMGEVHYAGEMTEEMRSMERAYLENKQAQEIAAAFDDAMKPDRDAVGYNQVSQQEQEAFDAVYAAFMEKTTATIAKRVEYDPSIPF